MKNAEYILFTTSVIVILVSWFSSTFKSGYVGYSAWSLMKDKRPKPEVNRKKIKPFVKGLCVALLLNVVYALVITRNAAIIIEFSLFNMVFIAYALVYWVLLKDLANRL